MQRSAYVILSSLYTLQLKTQARAKVRGSSFDIFREPEPSLSSVSKDESESNRSNSKVSGSFEIRISANSNVEEEENRQYESQKHDVRTLVSAAIAKLSLVLSSFWGKDDNFNEFPNAAGLGGNVLTSSITSQSSAGMISGKMSLGGLDKSSNLKHNSKTRAGTNDSSKILKIMLNLIITVFENSSSQRYSSSVDNGFGVEGARRKSATLPNIFGSNTDLASFEPPNSSKARKGRTFFPDSEPLKAPEVLRKPPLQLNKPVEEPLERLKTMMQTIFFDSSTVLCSAALANLAEIPQCRQALVSGGALHIIRTWLEMCADILKQAKELCFEAFPSRMDEKSESPRKSDSAAHSPSTPSSLGLNQPDYRSHNSYNAQQEKSDAFVLLFMKCFGLVYELINNSASALMHLSGGTDCRFQASTSHNSGGGSGGRKYHANDYMVGWIDAQILAEGLPEVIVKVIFLTTEDFTTISDHNVPTRSVLPAAVAMHFSQTIFQLCSRMQNRQELQDLKIPAALCVLFENIVNHVKARTNSNMTKTNYDQSIYSYIFDFGGIYSQGTHTGSIPIHIHDYESTNDLVSLYSTSIDERNRHRLSVHASHMTNSAINNKSSPVTVVTPGGYGKNAGNRIDHIYDFSEFDFTQATPRTRNDLLATSSELLSSSMMQMMISITTSCLNSLIFFLGDEYTKLGENPAVAVDATRTLYGTTCPTPASSCAASANSDHIVAFSLMLPLIDLISCQRMVDSILLATSSLPKGMGRLASIRIISSLTEWPVPPESLFDGATIEVLLSISSEAEDLKHQKNISLTVITSYSSKSNMHNGDDLGQNSMHLTKPTSIERNVSGASSISGSSIGNKSYRSGHHSHPADRASMISLLDGGGTPPTYGDDEEGESALEETLIVCYALANLGNTHEKYAKRMFNSGLFSIMSKLAKSQHIAICREALRCVSAMCPVISSDVLEKAVFFSPRKDSLFVELLDALSWGLRSPHEVVQRDAVYTTSKLAMINEMTQDLVVNGTLRQVISLLTDPTNDRDLRAISEEVLKNVGFHGGKKDFEICGFDYEVLRDWYVMRRALKPQEQAYDLLDAWIKQLFDDQFGDGELHHLRHKNFDPHDCNSLVRSAVSVLRKMSNSNELTEGDSPTNAKSSDYSQHVGGSLKSSTPTANANALAMPHLHRNFTDSFLKYFNPFCAKPPEKVPRHNTELRLDESDYHFSQSPTSDRDFFSPSHGLVHQMNRSLHVPSMAATATSGIQGFIGTGTAGSVAGSASGYHIDYAYDWIDRPPLTSTKLLDLFYTSKLHQHLLMDMNSLGTSVGLSGQLYCGVESDPYGVSSEDEDSEQRAYLLPHPHKISAILLPSRSYLSFALLGRVLEKVFEYEGNQKMWSLTFRDSEYEKDFHTSLISTLRRCPQICSLCFSSTHRVEDGAFLGHLVGQIPASVRFLSFKSTLSKESIQALCILLRTQNAAFIDQGNEGDLFYYGSTPLIINKDRSSLSSYAPYTASGTGGKTTSKTSKTIDNSSSGSEDKYRKANDRGLLGLALTHFTFEPSEVNHILELLYLPPRSIPHRKPSRMGLAGIKTPTGKMQRGSDPNISPSGSGPSLLSHAIKSSANNVAKESLRGLRFIDLSHNNLSDINCANILIAALNGPLEGLELAGNIINRGAKFLEVLESLQDGGKGPASFIKIDHGHHLRYLGISDNNLTAKTTFSVLKSFAENNTLTNLDVSCNELDHSKPTNELLRSFMRTNTTIRVLNLSYTKIDSEGIKAIHLGLLENSTMLMLPLAGNITEDKSSSISLIQVKLKENRMLYKARSVNDHFVSAMNLAVQMNLAGEVTSTDYNGSVVDAGEAEEYRISASDRNSNDESAITATPVSNKMYYSDNVVMTSATLLDSPSTVSTLTPAPTPIPTPLAAESKLSAKSPEKSNASEMSRNNAEDICVSVSELEAYQRNDSAHKMSVFDTKLTNPSEFPAKTTTIRSQSTTVHTTHSNTPTTLVTSTTPTSRADAEARRAPEVQYNYERSRQQRSASYSHAPRNVNGFNLYPLPMTVPVTLTVTMPSADSKGVPERNCMDYRIEHGNQSTHVGRNSGKSDSLPLSEKNVKLHTELTDQSTSLSSTGNASNTLNVLFSAPLAGFDRYSKPHPLEVLDHTGEREMLIQVFKEVHRDISLHFDYATTDSLRTALSFGCRALHFSGHGLPKGT